MKYEYIRLAVDFGDLYDINRLGAVGWHVVGVQPIPGEDYRVWVLMERELKCR